MPKLQDALSDASQRKAIVADCLVIIEQEVADKSGLSGMAIKTGYKVVKGVKPGFIQDAVEHLIDDFCKNLQPIADEATEKGATISSHFVANRGRVADALLVITDARAQRSKHGVVKSMYDKLRGSAKSNVEAAVPRVATLIEKYSK